MFGPMRTVHLSINDFRSLAQDAAEEFVSLKRDTARVELSSFPSGCEEHIKVTGPIYGNSVKISARISSSEDIMRLLLITDAVKRMGAWSVHLFIPYLPYARQDRVCGPGEALSASVMASLINSQGYSSVTSLDPHSDVIGALINNFSGVIPVGHVMSAVSIMPDAILFAPDAGAVKRVEKVAAMIGHNGEIGFAVKSRSADGSVSVHISRDSFTGANVVIVDDICDGGATFIGLAEALKQKGAARISLCVTHGIFSKGVGAMRDVGIDMFYCTNSFEPKKDRNLINITRI